jgi:hypothetical protein
MSRTIPLPRSAGWWIVAAAIMSGLVHLTLISHPDAVAEVISAAIGSWH